MIAVGVLVLGAALADEGVFPYEVHEHGLDNGLEVWVIPMPSPGVAAYYTWMSVGSRDEVDPGRTGFAHFFEHLMFYGTESVSREQREDRMLRFGAEDNAWTWLDETVYHAVVSTEHLPEHIELEADRFAHLALTEDDVRKEAGAVYGEFRKSQASPGQRLAADVWATAFTTHTYHHDTIGLEADIGDMPSAYTYARAFFSRFYRPDNADIVVVGDVDPDEVFRMVEAAYGDWEPAPEPRPEIPPEPPQTEPRSVHVAWPSPTGPRLTLAWKIPATDPDSREVAALELVDDILMSPIGPLERRLVKDERLAYAVWGGRGDFVDPSLFTVSVLARDAADFERIEAIVREEVAALASVDPELLDRIRTRTRYGFLSALDDPDTVAGSMGWWLRRGETADAIDRFYENYLEVTPDDVAAAASTWLVDAHLTRGTLVHEPDDAEPAGEEDAP